MSSGDDPAGSDRGNPGMQQVPTGAPTGGRPNMPAKGGAAAVGSLRDLLESLRFDMDSGAGGSGDAEDYEGYDGVHGGTAEGIPQGHDMGSGIYYEDEGQVFGEESATEENDENYPPGDHIHPDSHPNNAHHASGYSMNNESDVNEAYHRRSNPNITDDEGFGPTSPHSESDDSSYSGSSQSSGSSSDSVKSYEDAGYDNEEDYLFDQYGGIGGTAEERAELAEALMHTLNVGPMADDLFYEEVAMCFLRCRERHRMRTRREEMRERKRAKKRREKAGSKAGSKSSKGKRGKKKNRDNQGRNRAAAMGAKSENEATGDEAEMRERMAKMNMDNRHTTGVESEYEVHDDDDDDDDDHSVDLSRISENLRNVHVNVESDYEDVRRAKRRESRRRPRGMSRGHERDSSGMTGTGDEEEHLPPEDDSLPSTPMSSSDKEDDSFLGEEGYGHEGSYDSEYSGADKHHKAKAGRTEGHMEHDDEDDPGAYGDYPEGLDGQGEDVGVSVDGDRSPPRPPHANTGGYAQPPMDQHVEEPVFRVDLKSNGAQKGKKGAKAKGIGKKYPPPPPPPPPPRGSLPDGSAPMDVDDEQLHWEEKIARGARAAAEASAMKNDHESLRRDFSVGASDVEGRKGRGHVNQKSMYGFGPMGADDDFGASTEPAMGPDESDEAAAKRQRVASLRDEGRTYYINGAYRESVLCYTEAIGVHSDGLYYGPKNDETLAALYGNRAAALMMTGAYEGASADCDRALQCTEINSAAGSLESGPAFRSKILCRMARALLKAGSIWDADKAFNSSIQSAKEALAIVASAGNIEEARNMEKILNQSITDATLGLSDVKRYRDAAESAKAVEASKGSSPAADRRNNVQLLMFINSALSVAPGCMELHERKVNALASLKRWAELGNHCERLAAEMVKIDGLFKDDLAQLDPFPDVRPAGSLKPDFFERNPEDASDPVSLRILSPKAVCDAVIRLPNGILPLYLRSLRLEERYTEAAKAGASIETHMSNGKHKGSRGNVPMQWLSGERDKLRRTMSWKEKGDTLFRNGDYERAAEKYALCLTIDSDGTAYNHNALENEDAGGRLHAVLHCNRAACLMALKKYREAVKECTAALRIHTHYMKAMLRRGRCFARIRQYQEAVAEYERYIQLVHEARRSPANAASSNAACTFDRPIDITDQEYSKAKQELADVKKSMRQAAAQDQAQRKKQREQQFNFNKNFKAAANDAARSRRQEAPGRDTAHSRKKQWDSGAGSGNHHQQHRPWDTFGGTSPKKSGGRAKKEPPAGSRPSTGPSASRRSGGHRQTHGGQQQQPTVAKAPDTGDHYQVLGLVHTASSAEIKKAYHKMALKYHPDKNSEDGAADIFRRVKLAYEVLGNDATRISYDAQRRGGRR